MGKTKQKITILIFIIFFILFPSIVMAEASGNYISESIGDSNAISFEKIELMDQNKPAGTEIKYSFSGDNSNYQQWSSATKIDNSLILSNIEEIKNAKYIKLRISMTSPNSEVSPSLKGFSITYQRLIGESPTTTTTTTTSITATTTTTEPTSSTTISNNNGTPTNIESSTSIDSSISKLVASGSILWFNILIALVISLIIAYFLFKNKKEQ